MPVRVHPDAFSLVLFDAARLRALADGVLDRVGMADLAVDLDVDETSPLTRAAVASADPPRLWAESGALEDPKRPRELSSRRAADTLGRLFLRLRDRRTPGFGCPPPDADLPLPLATAWTVYCEGRLARAGLEVHEPRWRYHFRTRHAFSDSADAVFDHLWAADGLTWDDVVAASEAARRDPVVAGARPRDGHAQGT